MRGTFGKRRKTLRNGLKALGATGEVLDAVTIGLDQRPEELSVEEFVQLSNELFTLGAILTLPSTSQHDQ